MAIRRASEQTYVTFDPAENLEAVLESLAAFGSCRTGAARMKPDYTKVALVGFNCALRASSAAVRRFL